MPADSSGEGDYSPAELLRTWGSPWEVCRAGQDVAFTVAFPDSLRVCGVAVDGRPVQTTQGLFWLCGPTLPRAAEMTPANLRSSFSEEYLATDASLFVLDSRTGECCVSTVNAGGIPPLAAVLGRWWGYGIVGAMPLSSRVGMAYTWLGEWTPEGASTPVRFPRFVESSGGWIESMAKGRVSVQVLCIYVPPHPPVAVDWVAAYSEAGRESLTGSRTSVADYDLITYVWLPDGDGQVIERRLRPVDRYDLHGGGFDIRAIANGPDSLLYLRLGEAWRGELPDGPVVANP